jgi:hypothetical protein
MDFASAAQIFSGVPSDWLVIGCLAIIFIGFTMLRGTTLATALALSSPVAVVLFSQMQSAVLVGALTKQFHDGIAGALIFLGVEIVLLILFVRIVSVFAESSAPFAGIVAGVSTTVIVLCMWMQVGQLADLWHFSAQTQTIFGPSYACWWLLVAYLGLAFARS